MTGPANINDAVMPQPRITSDWKPHWQRFQTDLMAPSHTVAAIHKTNGSQREEVNVYQRQYSHVYHQRYAQLGPRCVQAFEEQCSNATAEVKQVQRLLELEDETPSFVVGTLVKDSLVNIKDPCDPLVAGCECRASDALYLEDESGRVTLEFADKEKKNYAIHEFCTGLIVGVQGQVTQDGGTFMVESLFLPKVQPPPTLVVTSSNDQEAPYLLLLSGLECGSSTVSSLTRDLLLCFLEGRFSHPAAARVSRIVLCGGLVTPGSSDALRDLDAFLFQVTAGAGIPVDLVPGAQDPTTANWPQRPLHPSLLQQSSDFGLVNRSPNPYEAHHGHGCCVLATDGTNVRDLQKHVLKQGSDDHSWSRLTELECLARLLEFGHSCPTGPSTVPTVPHAFKDPMVLQQMPHVFLAGSCSHFATAIVTAKDSPSTCRLVCVPSFGQTGEAVLLNLHTLSVELLRFEEE